MTMGLTIRDFKRIRATENEKIGVKIDFRIRPELREYQIEDLRDELNLKIESMELVMSGFGYVNYSGIVSTDNEKRWLQKKVKALKEWHLEHSDCFKQFKIGKVQRVRNIFYE